MCSFLDCHDTLLMFLVVCEKIYVEVVVNAYVVVDINYESIFSESNIVTIA